MEVVGSVSKGLQGEAGGIGMIFSVSGESENKLEVFFLGAARGTVLPSDRREYRARIDRIVNRTGRV